MSRTRRFAALSRQVWHLVAQTPLVRGLPLIPTLLRLLVNNYCDAKLKILYLFLQINYLDDRVFHYEAVGNADCISGNGIIFNAITV